MLEPTPKAHAMHGKRTRGSLDREIAELAGRQHGVVARRQLVALGLGRGAIEGRLAREQLHRVHQGAYAVGHRSLTRHGRWMAAALSAGPMAVLSHRSAAHLWQMLPMSSIAPEVTRPTRFRSRDGLTAHCSPLPPDEIAVVDRVPVTSVPRTILDIAASVSRHELENALNEVEVRQMRDVLSIPDLLDRYPRRAGSAVLREVFAGANAGRGVSRQKLENELRRLLSGTDLPRPRFNAHLAVAGRFFEVDCLWPSQRLIVELDGRAAHGTARAFERDRERDQLLMVDGWRVIRVTWRQLHDDPSDVLADLRALLRAAPPPTL